MSYKVLVADDSNNIQKVVKIIYEDRNIEITPCQDSKSLALIKDAGFDLVLLDFSIDENVSGYELAKNLKTKFKTKLILLFGTFDSIDEDSVEQAGIDGYLFKPFDSDKLLKLTDDILDISKEEIADVKVARESRGGAILSEHQDTLVADDTQIIDVGNKTITRVVSPVEAVGDETAWGVKIPGIIGDADEAIEESFSLNEDNQRIPEIIESDLTKTIIGGINSLKINAENEEIEATIYPSAEDLEYPEITASDIKLNLPKEFSKTKTKTRTETLSLNLQREIDIQVEASSSKLIPSKDLLIDISDDIDKPESTEIVEMDVNPDKDKETLKQLKKQIFEELDDDLWSEEHTNTNILMGELGKEVVNQNKSVTAIHSKKDLLEGLKADFYTEIRNEAIESLRKDLPEILKDELIPYFEKHIKDYCREAVEKGIWAILPDLAEKVIKKELEEIRRSIEKDD